MLKLVGQFAGADFYLGISKMAVKFDGYQGRIIRETCNRLHNSRQT